MAPAGCGGSDEEGPDSAGSFTKMTASVPPHPPCSLAAGLAEKICRWLPASLQSRARHWQGSSLGRRLARGAFWVLAGAGLARGLGLLASMFCARLLGATQFGELGIIQSTVGLFSVFAGFGLGLMATKYVAEFRETDRARAGRVLALSGGVAAISGTLLAGALLALAGPLATHSLAARHLAGLLRMSAPLILLGAINGAQTGGLAGFEAFKAVARINLVVGLASFPLTLAGVWLGGLAGVVWAMVAAVGLNCVMNHRALRAEAHRAGVPLPGLRGGRDELSLLWSFSLPAMLCSMMIVPVNWAGLTLLVHQPDGYLEMGVFNAANQWRIAILFVPQALSGIVLPALSNLNQPGEQRRYQRVFWSNVTLVGGVALGLAVLVVAASGWIVRGYGEAFVRGQLALVLLSLAAVVMSVNQVLGSDVISRGRMWAGLACNAAWAVTFLSLAWWLVPARGATGLALAVLLSYPIHSLCLLWLNLRPARSASVPNAARGPRLSAEPLASVPSRKNL